MALTLWLPFAASAETAPRSEYEVKAAFLYNFAKYVEWPQGAFLTPDAPISFCIFGRNPFAGALRDLTAEKSLGGRPLEVRNVATPAEAAGCHVLFISEDGATKDGLLRMLRGSPTLTVGESDDFLREGGVICLFLDDRNVRFAVNVGAAREQGLRVSSQLLKLARHVVGNEWEP